MPPIIVAAPNQKGGVGKTTLATKLSRTAPAALAHADDGARRPVRQRGVYPQASAQGESVPTLEPKGDAARELPILYRELPSLVPSLES